MKDTHRQLLYRVIVYLETVGPLVAGVHAIAHMDMDNDLAREHHDIIQALHDALESPEPQELSR